MPKMKCPKSLRQLCMMGICVKFELICYGKERTEKGSKAYIENMIANTDLSELPISYLPGSVLSDLLDVITKERTCAHHILHLLLQPHLTRVIIHNKINTRTAFHLLVARCANLTHLIIQGIKFLESGYWTEFFTNFKELRLLSLKGTRIDDFALEQIGLHCPKLISLNLASTPVTSQGLAFISEPQLCGTHPCQKLGYLNILDTQVDSQGVYEFLIYHNNIQKVEYESFEEVIKCFLVGNKTEQLQRRMELKSLTFLSCQGPFWQTFQKCTQIFASLDSISMMKCDLTNQVLENILQFEKLTKLELGNSNFTQYTVYFHENVLPILEHLGNRLLDLRLEKFKFVDVSAIGEHCPKLQKLKLSRILSFCNTDFCSKHSLLNLVELSILNTIGCRITEETLRLLLVSHYLHTIHLQFITTITDQFLLSVVQDNPLDHLHSITLQQCHNITINSLRLLLSCAPELGVLSCWSCAMVGEASRDQILTIVKEDNLDMQFQWYSSRLVPIPDDLEELAMHAGEEHHVPGILDMFPV